MDAAKLKSSPLVTSMPFGPNPETDTLNLWLDRDVITESFLIEMDAKGRHVFDARIAGLRQELQLRGLLPKPAAELDALAKGETKTKPRGTGKAGQRATRRKAAGKAPTDAERQAIAEQIVQQFEQLLPDKDGSVPLAQAQEMAYMAETLARVILAWDMVQKGKPALIIEPLMIDDAKAPGGRRLADCCAVEDNECRHASAFIRGMSYGVMSRFFQFCCFEAHQNEAKKNET
jgi:hypothetical protein